MPEEVGEGKKMDGIKEKHVDLAHHRGRNEYQLCLILEDTCLLLYAERLQNCVRCDCPFERMDD